MQAQPRKGCLAPDPYVASERLRVVSLCYSRVNRYWQRFREAIETPEESGHECPNLASQLADEAFDAERHLRVTLKVGLDSLNELMDSEGLEDAVLSLARLGGGQCDTDGLVAMLYNSKAAVIGQFPDLDTAFLDEAVRIVTEHRIAVQGSNNTLTVRFTGDDKRSYEITAETKSRPGQLGRISTRDFFAASPQRRVTTPIPLAFPEDCHHKPDDSFTVSTRDERIFDAYASLVAASAFGRELMYGHARQLDELGLIAFRGSDFGIAEIVIIIILLVTAIILIIAGIATNDGNLVGTGAIILGAFLCVLLFEACQITVGRTMGVGTT